MKLGSNTRFGSEERSMKNINAKFLLKLVTLGCIAFPVHAKDLFVIAHPSVALSAEEIQDVFIGDKQFAGSQKLVVTDNASAQSDFLGKVVKMETKRYSALWVKKSFRDGLAIPAVKSGDAEVVSFVKNTPGAIGYVTILPEGVKALAKFP
jgi:ABC-type phosphate transport system substrate-binding protein